MVITIDKLGVNYDQVIALKNVSFNINKLDFIGIIGPNGGGKTTLVKTILGIIEPTAGKIYISPREVIGYVPQLTTFNRQFPITVNDAILIGHLKKHIKIGQRFMKHEREHVFSVMKQLNIEHLKNRQIGTLSGGQMQKVLIARALMNHPTILVLDEPTAGVDQSSKKEIYLMLRQLNKHMTILMITHDTSDLMKYLNRIIYINKTSHIHDKVEKEKVNNIIKSCPIDWFVNGERIHNELLQSKGAKR